MVDPLPGAVRGGRAASGGAVPVHFDGEGAGVGELSWGQRELWRVMEEKHTWLPIGAPRPLPPGTTLDDAVADLRFVMSHYPSMRTRLWFDPDGPKQVVSGSGETRLEIVDADDGADPEEVAAQVRELHRDSDFDFADDWPLRMAVVRHRGRLTHRVWTMCHLATDGAGSRVVVEELADRDTSGSQAALTALDQARWQHSPAGQRQSAAALRHWEKILRSVPARRFPERTGAPYPRYWQAKTDSPATHLAVRAISARTGVEGPSVLLGVFAVALARVMGVNPVVLTLVVGNRFRPGLARTVSPVMQVSLCAIDVPPGTVDEAVVHTRRRAMAAYKQAYHDPYPRHELVARVNRERGEQVDTDCNFNDRRLKPRDDTGRAPTPEQIRAAEPRARFEWRYKQDAVEFNRLFVNVDDEPDTVALTMTADIHHVSPDDVEACARELQEVAVAAALDPATRTRVSAGGGQR